MRTIVRSLTAQIYSSSISILQQDWPRPPVPAQLQHCHEWPAITKTNTFCGSDLLSLALAWNLAQQGSSTVTFTYAQPPRLVTHSRSANSRSSRHQQG